MFKHYVYESEVTCVSGSELIGLSPKRNYLLKDMWIATDGSLCEYKIVCLVKDTIYVSISNQVLNILFIS